MRWPQPSIVAFTVLLSFASGVRAQTPPAPPTLEEGLKAFQAGQLETAAGDFQKIVAAEPGNAQAWFNLGLSLRGLERYDPAVTAFEHAIAAGYPETVAMASLAITYSLSGNLDKAFEKLKRAVDLGMQPTVLSSHPGFAAARKDPRFQALVETADKLAHPCENDPRYQAFDFWVGDWEAYSQGQKVGANRIEKILRGCVLFENWTGAGGSSGKSLNYFDVTQGKWHQNWVDENGLIAWYEGEVKDGAMHYQGETRSPTGTKSLSRVTLTPQPDGSVHHFVESSGDGGKTWTVAFDAVYVKKEQVPSR